jgi:uncharacterized membrane protein YhaH (DUF805 family)
MFSKSRPDRDDRKRPAGIVPPRSNRTGFWGALIGLSVAGLIAYAAIGTHALSLVVLCLGPLVVRLTAARLHDFGRTGWWAILPPGLVVALTVLIGRLPGSLVLVTGLALSTSILWLLIVGLMPGDLGPNRFGPPPRARNMRRAPAAEAA